MMGTLDLNYTMLHFSSCHLTFNVELLDNKNRTCSRKEVKTSRGRSGNWDGQVV